MIQRVILIFIKSEWTILHKSIILAIDATLSDILLTFQNPEVTGLCQQAKGLGLFLCLFCKGVSGCFWNYFAVFFSNWCEKSTRLYCMYVCYIQLLICVLKRVVFKGNDTRDGTYAGIVFLVHIMHFYTHELQG